MTLAALGFLAVSACTPPPTCDGGKQPYNGHCLSSATIAYFDCTKDRGFDSTSEISGGLAGTYRAVVGASLDAAYSETRTENTPVALQIAKDCVDISAREAETDAERSDVQDVQRQAAQAFEDWQREQVVHTARITTDKTSAATGDVVTVGGESFWPDETVDIRFGAILVTQESTDADGAFQAEITVPKALPIGFPADIVVTGQTSAKSATAPFQRKQ